jgi:hypothetical protein
VRATSDALIDNGVSVELSARRSLLVVVLVSTSRVGEIRHK